MKYFYSDFWTLKAKEISRKLDLNHVDTERVSVLKSTGSKSRRTIARIHTIGKVMQLGMKQKPFYTIELISEQFDRQPEEEKIKTIIHELLHIPKSFGGGFRNHKHYVNKLTVQSAFNRLSEQARLFEEQK